MTRLAEECRALGPDLGTKDKEAVYVKLESMASTASTVDYILEQMAGAGVVTARKMFGEYAIYCDGKIVALVCDDQLFVKPTPAGQSFIGECEYAPPYPGAKPYLLIGGEKWDDPQWLSQLIRFSAAELPLPKKKPVKQTRKAKRS